MENEYPEIPDVVIFGEEQSPLVRLCTAIRIACIDDYGRAVGVEYANTEIAPFEKIPNLHSYFRIEATGALARAEKKVIDAVRASIENGSLSVRVLRTSLGGEVSLMNSWISTSAFEAWCESRRIMLDDSWFQFIDQEQDIQIAGAKKSEQLRWRAEIPNFQEELEIVESEYGDKDQLGALEDLAALRSTDKWSGSQPERPLNKRERDTLLSIIAVLCKAAGYDYSKAAKTAGMIQGMAAEMKIAIGETTIEGHLKKIPNALGTRTK